MKLLLIYPLQKNVVYKIAPAVVAEEAGAYPPLGLLHLATSIVKQARHEVKILDTIVENMDYPEVENYINREKPDVVGITFITLYLRDALLVARIVKKINPGIPVIAGGPHVQLYPRETIQFPEIDYAVCGDGDYIITEILDRLEEHRSLDDLNGVITKTNCHKELQRLLVPDLNRLPIPMRQLLPYKKYKSVLAKGKPVTNLLTSRGCPFNCPFCTGGGVKPRAVLPSRVADEIESCLELGIKDIIFFDELFTLNKKRVFEICDEIINRSLKIRWQIRARIGTVDREMIRKLKKAGCRLIQFGIESGNERMQKILCKGFSLDKIIEIIKITKDEGILTYGNFMMGSPTETEQEIEETIEFAMKLPLDYAVFSITSVFPETEWYRLAFREGRLKEDFWAEFVKNPEYQVKSTFWPGEIPPERLEWLCQKAYLKFYVRPKYIFCTLLRHSSIGQIYMQAKSAVKLFLRLLIK